MRAYGVHRGVPSLTFFRWSGSCNHPHSQKAESASTGACRARNVPERPSGYAARSTQWRCRATLAAKRSGASLPATREAAGVPSAWSQSHPVTLARPRRWCDAGPPKAAQKAGAQGSQATRRTSRTPALRRVPLSLGEAIQTAARLKVGPAPPYGGRDARPHNGGSERGPDLDRVDDPLKPRPNFISHAGDLGVGDQGERRRRVHGRHSRATTLAFAHAHIAG